MAPKTISVPQSRALARIQRLNPGADIRLHQAHGGVIVEIRTGRRLALAHIGPTGELERDHSLQPHAA
ncbi:MAG TPA: hypothetical protein VHX88_01835 [Solirubrobacteraceae bacterium]|jgi:hypothetical protein|nr:hypothetical protein [Solirubrobacteraceae bacterium]